MKRTVLATALLTVGGFSMGAASFQQPSQQTVRQIQKLRDNLYFLSGGDTYERQLRQAFEYWRIRR